MAEVIQQIRIARALCERRCEAGDSLGQLAGFDLRDTQCVQRADTLQMRNRLRRVSLRQERITDQLVSDWEVRAELERAFQRSDGCAVVALLHVGAAQI